MSYLDLPRIQFGGLFFTNPSTINNYWTSYNEMVQLSDQQGQYLTQAAGGGPSGWNAIGVAQLWLAECRVLSGVDSSGQGVDASDPVIGAPVETPSPQTPKQGPDGYYDIAKLVDLDPMQQQRSRGYGLRLFVTLPGGGGFSGALSVPELRYMGGRIPLRGGSWTAVGNWMGTISEVEWQGDVSSSPFLQAFREASAGGVSVKIAMDLHQNNPANKFTTGDMLYYGRVLGSMGPAEPGELAQVVPGRMLSRPATRAPSARGMAAAEAAAPAPDVLESLRSVVGQTIEDRSQEQSAGHEAPDAPAAAAARTAARLQPWNPAFAQVSEQDGKSTLHLDLSFAIKLKVDKEDGKPVVLGKFEVDSGIQVGVLDGSGQVTPLQNGAVSFTYTFLDSKNKRCYLVNDGGIVDIALEPKEVSLVASQPLAVRVNGTTVLAEPSDGLFMDLSLDSLRLYSGQHHDIRLMARKFGRPPVGEKPVKWTLLDMNNAPLAADEVAIDWRSATDANGIATLRVSVTNSDQLVIPPSRQPLDSLLFFAVLFDTSGQPIGDGTSNYNLSVLMWPPFDVPGRISWDHDVGPVLGAYARLYPGMKEKLNIGDETTVEGFAESMYDRMSRPFDDPGYMPVTRDLSPPKVKMVLEWLKQFLPPKGS